MKIGIVGLGSIGQRHVRCLKTLGQTDVVALRTGKGAKEKLDEVSHVQDVSDVKEFYALNLDGVIISNPTALHVEAMKLALEKEIPVFVEKPIAAELEELDGLEGQDTTKIMVGYNLRSNEIIHAVKEFLDTGKLGRVYKADLYCGQYLPAWHPYADYKKEYYSKKALGGGVLRTLSHEIDLMNYFFGVPKELSAVVEKISDLEIDVDDHAQLMCRMTDGVLVNVELDYLDPKNTRTGSVFGANGKLEYSFLTSKVVFTDNQGKETVLYENADLDWNEMYVKQMEKFIKFIEKGENPCSYADGKIVMQVVHAAEESSKSKTWQERPI